MANNMSLDLGDHLNFSSMLLYLASYFVVERVIKSIFIHVYPQFYARLYNERKDIQYFAFIMGILITIFSTPICYKALQESNSTNSTFETPSLSKAGEMCVASRGVLWSSELNRLDHSNIFIAHHISSIGYLIYHIQTQQPLRLMYAFYTSLFTELFSDLSCLLTIHEFRTTTSSLAYRVQVTNTIFLVVLRLPPILYSAQYVATLSPTTPMFWIDGFCLLVYLGFIVNIILAASKRLKLFQLEIKKPAYIRIGQRFDISLYGIFFSIASFVTASLSAIIYIQSKNTPPTSAEISKLGVQLLITGAASYIGARAPSYIRQGISNFLFTKFLTRSNLWIQGSFLAAVLSISISPLVERTRLLRAFCLAFPMGECLGQVGCYFAGCCEGKRLRSFPTQILSSLLNGMMGILILVFWGRGSWSFKEAAVFSLGVNAVIRLLLRGNLFSVSQLFGALTMMVLHARRRMVLSSNSSNFGNKSLGNSFHGSNLIPEVNFLEGPWVALLALGSVLAGSLVQGPMAEEIRADLRQACDGNHTEIDTKEKERNTNAP